MNKKSIKKIIVKRYTEMSNSFNDQLSRMKALMTYGSVNENAKPISTYTLEYKAKAADGKYYGIIRENSKYFVKVATPGQETIAESYQYIGGINNKTSYEYNSYANALKHFELKLGSINEAYDEDRRVVTESLDPFKKEDLVIEGTDKMKNELARQRQIMRNASVIMNEATEIGSTPFKTQPEAEHDNSGDKDYPFTKEGKPEEDRGAIKFGEGDPDKHSTTFGPDSKDVEDYDLDKGATPKVADSVASENPSGGKVVRVNEGMEECGLPECGTGLFAEEGDEDELEAPVDEPVDTDELAPADDLEGDAELDAEPEVEDELGDEEVEDELGDEEDVDFDDDDDFDFEDDEDELGDEEVEDDDFDFDDEEDEFGDEEEFDGEEEPEFGEEEVGVETGDDEFGDEEEPEVELDENIVKKFRQLVRESINELMNEWDSDDDLEGRIGQEGPYDSKFDKDFDEALPDDEEEDDDDDVAGLNEAKLRKMDSIVESVVNDILNEDELHVFGDHPGYRKKPMDLPPTGSDKFQVNRDWNDDSVHSEEPFGKGKGDSTPFDELVAQITDSVMKQINEGSKKKVK